MGFLSTIGSASARAYGFTRSAVAAATDAFFNRVTLLLNTSSTNGAQNNTFLDSSSNNFTITRNGNTTQGTFTPFSQTGWSNNFVSSAALSVDYTANLQLQNTNWTIESYFNLSSASAEFCVMGASNGGGGVPKYFMGGNWSTAFGYNANRATFFTYTAGASRFIDVPFTWQIGRWYHMAAVYTHSNTTTTLYIDGVSVGSISYGIDNCTGAVLIARNGEGGGILTGYISNFRYIVGTSLYTSNFTPSTTPLTAITNTQILTCQSNRFVDNSGNSRAVSIAAGTPSVQAFSPFLPTAAYDTAVVGGSGYFDGTGDYLSLSSTSLNLGSNDFTIETWVYATTTARDFVIGSLKNADGTGSWVIMFNDAQPIRFFCRYNGGTVLDYQVGSGTFPTNQWVHLAVTRSGANLRVFQNGTQVGTTNTTLSTFSIDNASTNYYVGSSTDPSEFYTGYLSCTRLLVGTALYTTTFTPPTAPPTAITNTSLLLNYTNAGIFDSASKNVLETVGNAQVSTTVAKWGTTSMYFDGTGDYLFQPNGVNQNFAFRTGNFTIECWLYLNKVTGDQVITDFRAANDARTSAFSFSTSGTTLSIYSGTVKSLGGTLATGTWYHIALVKNGTGSNNTTAYINGTATGTTITLTDDYTDTSIQIGSVAGGTTASLDGYIDDLRITKGYARYTANFTPPTAAFPVQ